MYIHNYALDIQQLDIVCCYFSLSALLTAKGAGKCAVPVISQMANSCRFYYLILVPVLQKGC